MVVARVRMDKLDAPAYTAVFRAIFSSVKSEYSDFEVGKTLKGIVADWSDTQLLGLSNAVGKDVADNVMKGCQVNNYCM